LFVGDHTVEVFMGGQAVPGSPFLVKAYDSSKVKVADITSGIRGKPVYFSSKLKHVINLYHFVECCLASSKYF